MLAGVVVSASRSGSSTTRSPTRCRSAVAAIVLASPAGVRRRTEPCCADLAVVAAGFWLVAAVVARLLRGAGALEDLWLATIDYNLRYSGETYAGAAERRCVSRS